MSTLLDKHKRIVEQAKNSGCKSITMSLDEHRIIVSYLESYEDRLELLKEALNIARNVSAKPM